MVLISVNTLLYFVINIDNVIYFNTYVDCHHRWKWCKLLFANSWIFCLSVISPTLSSFFWGAMRLMPQFHVPCYLSTSTIPKPEKAQIIIPRSSNTVLLSGSFCAIEICGQCSIISSLQTRWTLSCPGSYIHHHFSPSPLCFIAHLFQFMWYTSVVLLFTQFSVILSLVWLSVGMIVLFIILIYIMGYSPFP